MRLKPYLISGCALSASLYIAAATESANSADTPDAQVAASDTASFNEDDFTNLDELVVVERQKLVKSDGATLTYNVT
ncbi:MAG: hypothetical protein K2H76_06255, partial [Muribaculaceae bacterium]|nr:hypothetical protein [Muribaculaceae bacterium]